MARPKFPSDDVDRIMLRLPGGMRERVAAAAAENNRSMNSEILARLEYTLDEPRRIAEEKAKMEAFLIEERKDAMKRQAESLHIRMADMAEQLARIEAFLSEQDTKAKAPK